jgi:hypothetical protein
MQGGVHQHHQHEDRQDHRQRQVASHEERVGDHEIDALDVRTHHVGDGIAASPADADHADPRAKLVDFRPDKIDAHDLKSPQCDNALSLHDESMNHCESPAKRKS